MSRPVDFRPEAQAELEDAYAWYEEQRTGLGEHFLLCIEEKISAIRRQPETYPTVHRTVRRALIRRFPYGIYYIIEENRVVVIAIFHSRRDPKQWKSRE